MFYESVANHVRDAHLAILSPAIVRIVDDNALGSQLRQFASLAANQALLVKREWRSVDMADLVEAHFEELAMLDTLDLGAPYSRTIMGKARAGALLAEHVLGGDSELMTDAMALAGPNRLPPKLFVDLGVKARLVWSRLRHRGED